MLDMCLNQQRHACFSYLEVSFNHDKNIMHICLLPYAHEISLASIHTCMHPCEILIRLYPLYGPYRQQYTLCYCMPNAFWLKGAPNSQNTFGIRFGLYIILESATL